MTIIHSKTSKIIGRPFKFNAFPKVQTFAKTHLQLWANSVGKENNDSRIGFCMGILALCNYPQLS